jgi:hypothetical protein
MIISKVPRALHDLVQITSRLEVIRLFFRLLVTYKKCSMWQRSFALLADLRVNKCRKDPRHCSEIP